MEKTEATVLLKQLIATKETELLAEGKLLKTEFTEVIETFKPANLINNTLKDVASSKEVKKQIGNVAFGVLTGMVAKKLFVGDSSSLVKKISGSMLEMYIAGKVTNNATEIKAIAAIMIRKLTQGSLEEKSNTMPH